MILSLGDYLALGTLAVAIIGPLFGLVLKIKRNDLRHLDDKIDELNTNVQRVGETMTEHIRDHAAGLFR